MPRKKIATVALAGALTALAATASYAAPPQSLPTPAVSPSTVVPGGELLVAGSGCIGTGGTPGVVTLTLQNSDGTVLTDQVTDLDANGGWAAQYSAPDALGVYEVRASCDLYGSTLAYPLVLVTVNVDGGSAPPADADRDEPQPGELDVDADVDGSGVTQAGADSTRGSATGRDASKPSGELPTTGSPLGEVGLIAGGLLVGGAAAAYAGRRRGGSAT